VVRHKYFEAAIIVGLQAFNAALAYFQEGQSSYSQSFEVPSRAERFSVPSWGLETVPATELV
jgi:hypothetical protein